MKINKVAVFKANKLPSIKDQKKVFGTFSAQKGPNFVKKKLSWEFLGRVDQKRVTDFGYKEDFLHLILVQ
jgi:hypothetical protein